MRLGIFDSGIGGEAVAKSLAESFHRANILTVSDHDNVPYGDKPPELILELTDRSIQPLLEAGCDIIIIACNTATAVAIEFLRTKYPSQKFIGLEPMIKTAAELSNSGIVAVCATPATLASERYENLKQRFAKDLTILEPDCSDWARMIEHDQINHRLIAQTINYIYQQDADIIVLGCTHYHWIKQLIADLATEKIKVIDPSEAIARRIRQLLELS